MKAIIFAFLAISLNLFANSPNAAVVKAGEINIIQADQGLSLVPGRIDVNLSVKTKSSQLPKIKGLNSSGKCQHLNTLISYSGYDRSKQLFVRVYEIQFLAQTRNPSLPCKFIIETDSGFAEAQKTRVVVLEK
jgi:hypothetical protein